MLRPSAELASCAALVPEHLQGLEVSLDSRLEINLRGGAAALGEVLTGAARTLEPITWEINHLYASASRQGLR